MSIDCPPKHHPSPLSPHEVVPTGPPAVANENYGNLLDYRDVIDLRGRDKQVARTAKLGYSHRKTVRGGISSWLGCLLVASVLVGTAHRGLERRYPGRIHQSTGPPEFWLLVSATMRAAAAELGINVDIRHTERSYDMAIALARDFLSERPPPDYLIATNDLGAGGAIIKLADAANVPMILLSNELDQKQWAEYGEPRTKYPHWLGSIVPDHEGGGYGIAEAVLTEAARIKNRPLKLLALTGDIDTPASNDRVRGLKAVAVAVG